MTARTSDLLRAPDTHANRPAATAVPSGCLYACTTHSKIYRSDGSSWADWATVGGAAGALLITNNLSDLGSASTARTNLGLAAVAASGSASDLGSGTVATARLGSGTADNTKFLRGDQTWAVPGGGGGSYTAVLDTFNRADSSTIGTTSGGGGQRWFPLSGSWQIVSNTLKDTSSAAEHYIGLFAGAQRGIRTHTVVLGTKPSTGDGGYMFRADSTLNGLLLNAEAAWKLYTRAGGTYTQITPVSGTMPAPANADSIVITDDGYRVTIVFNGSTTVVFDTTYSLGGYVGFRSGSSTNYTFDSLTVTDSA